MRVPPADAAGASGAVSLDFAQHNEAMSLFAQPASAVQLAHGMLRLTAADMLQTGTALVAVPLLNETSEFEVSFNVFIGGGSGGEGVSFNVGALPSAQFGERGVSAALSVQLITAMRRVEVWHAHALLAQSVGELSLRQDRFVPVVITYGEEGLSVRLTAPVSLCHACHVEPGQLLEDGLALEQARPSTIYMRSTAFRSVRVLASESGRFRWK